jgi:hypothetical protein
MFQPLVVGGSDENLRTEFAASEAIVHDFVATLLIATLTQDCLDDLHFAAFGEGRTVR